MTTQPLPALASGDPSAWDQALYAFLVEKGNRSGSRRTVESYSRMLWPFFAERGLTPDRVKPRDVLGWVHGISRSGRTPSSSTVGARIACLSSFYRFLIRMGLVVSNPTDAVEPPRSVQSVAPGYSADEVRRLLAVIPDRVAGDPPVAPLDRLAREAVHGARSSMRGKRPELVDAAVRSALRETVFRFELVMRINVTTHELLDREELIAALFASQLAMLLREEGAQRRADHSHLGRLKLCRRLTLLRVNELLASREARTSVEVRYLDGHAALFPDIAAAFEEQLRTSQEVAITAMRAAELDGLEPAPPEDPEAVKVRAGELVADLVEPAKSETLDKLGEGSQALSIAAGWVRGKLAPRADVTTDVASPGAP